MKKENLIDYADCLMLAALKKCGNRTDADDLVQETMLAALLYLKNGGEVQYPKTWLMNVMNNKYYDMLRVKYNKPQVSCTYMENELPYYDSGLEEIEKSSEMETLRRELAHISKMYRDIMIAHYMNGDKVEKIAERFNIPVGTVKSRLDTGRKQLKKGMESMENYAKQSYAPEFLNVTWTGKAGMNMEPTGVVNGNKIAQNLLILAYDEPLTEPELARKIGIALPYIEPIVQKLVDCQLMARKENKVYTDFVIYKPDSEESNKAKEEQIKFAKENFDLFWNTIKEMFVKASETAIYQTLNCRQKKDLEYYMFLYALQRAKTNAKVPEKQNDMEIPDRPNGGKWFALGFSYNPNVQNRKYGTYGLGGLRTCDMNNKSNKYFKGKYLETREFDNGYDRHTRYTQPNLNAYIGGMRMLLYAVHENISPDSLKISDAMIESIPWYTECGIFAREGDVLRVDIPVLTSDEAKEIDALVFSAAEKIADNISTRYSELLKRNKTAIPSHLNLPTYMYYREGDDILEMAVVFEAMERRLFLPDLEKTGEIYPAMIMVYDR